MKNTYIIILYVTILFPSIWLQAQSHFEVAINQTGLYQLIIFSSSITGLDSGDEIVVFDLNGLQNSGDCSSVNGEVLVGAGMWQGEQLEISAIGSVDNCSFGGSQLAGFVDGNSIVVRVWDNSEDKKYETFLIITGGNNTFSSPGPTVISELNILGCTDDTACNYDPDAAADDDSCTYAEENYDCDENCTNSDCAGVCGGSAELDECGVCGGSGIPDGDCDCLGNVLDECNVCGGDGVDTDTDGICDNVDDCVGEYDACGVCNGPGSTAECGCSDIPDGDCDCLGNVLDECNVCGGDGIPSGDCDCAGNVEDCAGDCGGSAIVDECGVCNGENECLSLNELIIPDHYRIFSIYPNPFNPLTSITYGLPENGNVKINVYNIQGRQVETIVNTFQTAEYHSINWNASNYPSGVYLIRMESGDFTQTQKLVLVK